jgi:hypothetical protein
MGELARKALEMIKARGGRVVDIDLIKKTLQEIGKEYKPGLLAWIRTEYRHSRWKEMLSLEDEINRTTLAGDETGLKAALSTYKAFFQEVLEIYEKAEELPLYG